MTLFPHPFCFSVYQLRGHHFDIIEVIKAEPRAVPNALTEHNFQEAFKKMAEAVGTMHTRGREQLQG
jgi:hypothetical protein